MTACSNWLVFTSSVLNFIYIYSQSNSIIYIKEIIKKRTRHSCTNVFTAVADLQVLISFICTIIRISFDFLIYIYIASESCVAITDFNCRLQNDGNKTSWVSANNRDAPKGMWYWFLYRFVYALFSIYPFHSNRWLIYQY